MQILLQLDISLTESNDQSTYKGDLKKTFANALNSIVNVNKERLKIQEKLNKLNDYFGKEQLRTLFDDAGIDPRIFVLVMDLDVSIIFHLTQKLLFIKWTRFRLCASLDF